MAFLCCCSGRPGDVLIHSSDQGLYATVVLKFGAVGLECAEDLTHEDTKQPMTFVLLAIRAFIPEDAIKIKQFFGAYPKGIHLKWQF